MSCLKILAATGLVICLAGCLRSLHPLFTPEDKLFDPALLGTWRDAKDKQQWFFRRGKDSTYDLVFTEDGESGRFVAVLGQIGEHRFLDLYPEEPETEIGSDLYQLHLLAVHTFWKTRVGGDSLEMALLDQERFKKLVKEGRTGIPYEDLDGTLVLTASTEQLQAFLRQRGAEVFEDADLFFRQSAEAVQE